MGNWQAKEESAGRDLTTLHTEHGTVHRKEDNSGALLGKMEINADGGTSIVILGVQIALVCLIVLIVAYTAFKLFELWERKKNFESYFFHTTGGHARPKGSEEAERHLAKWGPSPLYHYEITDEYCERERARVPKHLAQRYVFRDGRGVWELKHPASPRPSQDLYVCESRMIEDDVL